MHNVAPESITIKCTLVFGLKTAIPTKLVGLVGNPILRDQLEKSNLRVCKYFYNPLWLLELSEKKDQAFDAF